MVAAQMLQHPVVAIAVVIWVHARVASCCLCVWELLTVKDSILKRGLELRGLLMSQHTNLS